MGSPNQASFNEVDSSEFVSYLEGTKDVFTPAMYRNINLNNRHSPSQGKLESLSLLDVESHLRYTRRFETGYVSPKRELHFLSECLEKMINLDSCQMKYVFLVFLPLIQHTDCYEVCHSLRM